MRLRRWLGGGGALPLGVLAGLNLVDEFDRIAFSALSPEIRDAFELSDAQILALNVVPGILILLAAGPTGWLADRYSRVAVSFGAALTWGLATVLTGLVPTALLLLVVRIAAGVGRTANEIVHPSLLSDLYEVRVHPRVFLVHRLANPIAQGSGVVAGVLASQFGWTWAFYLLALPTLLLALLLTQLRDPGRRGVTPAATGQGVSVVEAVRRLGAVRSLRRFWATAFALSVAAFGMFSLASLYFEQEFDFGPQARGFVQFVIGVGWIGGVWLGGLMADRRVGEERFEQLAVLCGNAFVLFVVGGLGLAVAPTSWVAVLFVGVLAAGNGVWQSPYFSAVGRIAPAGLSGQAFASSVLVYALGGFGALAIGIVADASTLRIGFVLVAAAGLAASVLARSVAPLIRADLAAAPESPPARCA